MTILIILIIIIGSFALWIMATYNRLVRLKALKEKTWNTIDTILKQRFELLPEILKTAKSLTENNTLPEDISASGADIAQAGGDIEKRVAAENKFTEQLTILFTAVNKASQTETELTRRISEIANTLQPVCRSYNAAAEAYNGIISSFPCRYAANFLGIKPAAVFKEPLIQQAD